MARWGNRRLKFVKIAQNSVSLLHPNPFHVKVSEQQGRCHVIIYLQTSQDFYSENHGFLNDFKF